MSLHIANIEKGLVDLRTAVKSLIPVENKDEVYSFLTDVKALIDCKDIPSWIKGKDGRMLYLNPAYTKVFGVTLDEYIGVKDYINWTEGVARSFRDNDAIVAESGCQQTFTEEVTVDGVSLKYKIIKWPVYVNGQLIGIAGESHGVQDD